MGTASYSMKNPYKVQRSLNGSNIKLMWLIKRPIGDFGFETLGTVKSDNWLFWEPFSPLIWPWLNICIEMALVSAYHTWSWSDWECVRWLQLHSGSLTASGLPVFFFSRFYKQLTWGIWVSSNCCAGSLLGSSLLSCHAQATIVVVFLPSCNHRQMAVGHFMLMGLFPRANKLGLLIKWGVM